MTDIQQWRRMVQPSRSKTTAISVPEDHDHEAVSNPGTPRKRPRPRFSSYFSHHGHAGGASKADIVAPDYFSMSRTTSVSQAEATTFPNPEADSLVDAVMCRLLADPFKGLDAQQNSSLLRILEGCRELRAEKQHLETKLHNEVESRYAAMIEVQRAEKRWSEEKEEYKAEIKRLELLIAKGKRGIADVIRARQDSVLRRRSRPNEVSEDVPMDQKETIFEFLTRSRRDEELMRQSQRVLIRPLSPSHKMAALSSKVSMTSFHAELPFGTPPRYGPSTLAEASLLEEVSASTEPNSARSRTHSLPKARASGSDDTFSTFSSAGDLLPDEAGEDTVTALPDEKEMADVRRFATLLSRRRGVSAESVIPTIMELFNNGRADDREALASVTGLGIEFVAPRAVSLDKALPPISARIPRTDSLTSKGLSFFQKKRPSLHVDPENHEIRRFSFDPGDDQDPVALRGGSFANRVLRRIASLSSLQTKLVAIASREPIFASAGPSPLPSPQLPSSRRSSKIPSPAFSLSRPRRDGSTSSLLTAIKQGDDGSQRASSISSSVYSSSSSDRPAFSSGGKDNQRPITDCTNGLVAGARTLGSASASTRSSNSVPNQARHGKQSSSQGGASSASAKFTPSIVGSGDKAKENIRLLGLGDDRIDSPIHVPDLREGPAP